MFKKIAFLFCLILVNVARADEFEDATKMIFGNDSKNKFLYYHPTYFIFGKDDLKLQFSGKYRVANKFDLYLGYTQTMYWSIYYTSQPFKDINYNPELFYRIVDEKYQFLKSLDLGFIHSSNGKDGEASRSINRLYVKTNLATKIGRHHLIGDLMFYDIITKEKNNKEIRKNMGYWDFTFYLTDLIVHDTSRLNLEFRIFAGDKIFNVNKGGRSLGLIYHLGSDDFNPAL
ncbi:MAG: phospholipase A [Bacteriovorax sp.]|nr:phospholipase A [Bacteriovorax sp.]